LYLYTEKYIKQNTIQYHETRQKRDTKKNFFVVEERKKEDAKGLEKKMDSVRSSKDKGKNGKERMHACR